VDSLHTKAGSSGVVELHGTLDWVECIGDGTSPVNGASSGDSYTTGGTQTSSHTGFGCGYRVERRVFQEELVSLNPSFLPVLQQRMEATRRRLLQHQVRELVNMTVMCHVFMNVMNDMTDEECHVCLIDNMTNEERHE
jgi:hypothetical protein